MCYSGMVWNDYMKMIRVTGADISWDEFKRIFGDRPQKRFDFPKALDAAFLKDPQPSAAPIRAMIEAYQRDEAARLEQELFKQKKRLGDAERSLQSKTTKKALEDQRIAGRKIEWALEKLADLRRTALEPRDSRIFPGWYAPVIVWENGRRVVKPMRYLCRPAGKPAFYDTKFPGTYNARRDSLGNYWRDLFGRTHAIAIFDAFYENVSRHDLEGRELAPGEKEQNVILEFRPRTAQPMFVACLWSHWVGGGGDELLSFAAITDEPPPEVRAAGHDRCVIPVKPGNIDAWLQGGDPAQMQAILDDRERPFYEHRKAA